jgi:hypothetical protein
MRKHFDAINQQRITQESLARSLHWYSDGHIENDLTRKMLWSFAMHTCNDITLGYICGADPVLLCAFEDTVALWGQASLEREEWRPYTRPLNETELRQQYYLDVGKVFDRKEPTRPEVWFEANLVLITDHWLRTGSLDHSMIAKMFAQDLEGFHPLQGVGELLNLLPLSAWPEILLADQYPYWHPSVPAWRKKRHTDATVRFVQALASDPEQLHDRTSPLRKRARGIMKRNMATNWLGGIGIRSAMNWLRTFEWREGQSGLSPREVMLRAYAYMPEVEAPANIAAEVASLRKIPI